MYYSRARVLYGSTSEQYGSASEQYGSSSALYGSASVQSGSSGVLYGSASEQYGSASEQYGSSSALYGSASVQSGSSGVLHGSASVLTVVARDAGVLGVVTVVFSPAFERAALQVRLASRAFRVVHPDRSAPRPDAGQGGAAPAAEHGECIINLS